MVAGLNGFKTMTVSKLSGGVPRFAIIGFLGMIVFTMMEKLEESLARMVLHLTWDISAILTATSTASLVAVGMGRGEIAIAPTIIGG